MYLKSLTLKGFKSFADRTHMVFDPGLTVVVGPNGSGKSNVSDAVLWVLGEQSAKSLRGQAMEDVIFSGSSARKAVAVAEVTLVLDNTDHTLPVDFSEVGVTRRMYRSGESEYLINGAPARLMDIQDILHDSGLGKETHSIISQGKLDAVLSSRPEERRALIEEAAGISKHRRRKERSQRKLKAMDEHVRRAKDLDREIRRQLRPLERQVDKAQRFNELEGRRQTLAVTLAVDDLRRLRREWNAVTSEGREAEAAVELARYRADDRSHNLEKLQTMLEEKGLFVGDLGEQRRRVQDQLGRIESDMRLLEEKGRNMVERLSETRMSLSAIQRQRTEAAQETVAVTRDLEAARAAKVQHAEAVEATGPAAQEAKAAREALDREAAQVSAEQRSCQRTADNATLAHVRLKEQVSNAELEDGMYASRLEQLDDSIETAESVLTSRRARLAELDHEAQDLRSRLDEAGRTISTHSKELSEAHRAEDKARAALSEAKAALGGLKSVERAERATSPLVVTLAEGPLAPKIRCRLADLVEAPADLEALTERVLGESVAALVVEGPSEVADLVHGALAVSDGSGTASIVSLKASGAPTTGDDLPGRSLLAQLTVAPEAQGLMEALLGGIRVVDSIEEAQAAHGTHPQLTYVTADGVRLDPTGQVRVGNPDHGMSGALERTRRIREMEAAIPGLEEELAGAHSATKEAQAALNAARDLQGRIRSDLSRTQGEADSVHGETGRLEKQLETAKAERTTVAQKRADHAAKAEESRPKLEALAKEAAEAQEKAQALTVRLEELEAARAEARTRESELQSQASEAKLALATVTERLRHLEDRSRELTRNLQNLEKRAAAAVDSTRALEVLRLRVDPLHNTYATLQERVRGWAERLRDRASLAEADSADLKKTIADAKEEVRAATAELEGAQAKAQEAQVAAGRLEERVQAAVEAIEALGVMALEDALELPEPEDRDAMARELSSLQGKIEKLGPVNQVAMEEYTRLKERADHIASQLEDLTHARGALEKITAAIDRKMRRAFVDTYHRVDANFQEIFSILFPGGNAHLELTDPDHPDLTGIEIVAQPRGKRIPKLALLSGGEKSLCALALLFAVYRTRTVPFYIFDEVEAALDDSNLDKLLGAIETLKETTQLIVISHQRRTMEQADVLYGVSMQADGVSHVVSQRLDGATGKVVDA